MKRLFATLALLPGLLSGQLLDDMTGGYIGGTAITAAYQNGVQVWSAGPPNIYDKSNAANPDSEANATTGITASNANYSVASVAASGGATGSYMIRITTSVTGSGVVYIAPPAGLSSGSYTVTADIAYTGPNNTEQYYTSTSDEWSTGVIDAFVNVDGTWEEVTITDTYTGFVDANSGRIRIYLDSNFASGNTLFIDNIRWIAN